LKNNNLIIITGSSGGIGKELSEFFLEAGYSVIGIDKSHDKIISDKKFIHIEFNLEEVKSEEAFKRFLIDLETKIDNMKVLSLINNAAIQTLKNLEQITIEDLIRSFSINTFAPVLLMKNLKKHLSASQGTIINISSIHRRLTKNKFSIYAATKASLTSFTKSLSIELGDKITVIGLEPGATLTPMLEEGFKDDLHKLDELISLHPTKSIGAPSDLAKICLFLIQSNLRPLNGSILSLDGGIGNILKDPD
jgi:NAD(P)-dependent dehydrogenase (short-subunit alcohol dehydrogenase family)